MKYQRHKLYKTQRWRRLREAALTRDSHTCQRHLRMTGENVYGNIVHHIISIEEDESKAFDLDNLETVCASCHNKDHPEKGMNKTKVAKKNKRNLRIYKVSNKEIY